MSYGQHCLQYVVWLRAYCPIRSPAQNVLHPTRTAKQLGSLIWGVQPSKFGWTMVSDLTDIYKPDIGSPLPASRIVLFGSIAHLELAISLHLGWQGACMQYVMNETSVLDTHAGLVRDHFWRQQNFTVAVILTATSRNTFISQRAAEQYLGTNTLVQPQYSLCPKHRKFSCSKRHVLPCLLAFGVPFHILRYLH